jgi:hypothetical protein
MSSGNDKPPPNPARLAFYVALLLAVNVGCVLWLVLFLETGALVAVAIVLGASLLSVLLLAWQRRPR